MAMEAEIEAGTVGVGGVGLVDGAGIWPEVEEEDYEVQLQAKVAALKDMFSPWLGTLESPPEIFRSKLTHFRTRCRFALAPDPDADDSSPANNDLHYLLWEGGTASKHADSFPGAVEGICQLMDPVRIGVSRDPRLRQGVRAVHFMSNTKADDRVVTLVYDQPLHSDWEAAVRELGLGEGVSVIGRSKGCVRLLGRDHVIESIPVRGKMLQYEQVEGSFSNPNASVNAATLQWLCECADAICPLLPPSRPDLLELYCGGGNHTCALAGRFRTVVGVEIDQKLVESAARNLARNMCGNAHVLCCQAESFCKKVLREKRVRVPNVGECVFDCILVDPPRAGLDATTLSLTALYSHVIYISCNPSSLHRDLQVLCDTHDILRYCVLDHFPYTRHVECACYCRKRS